MPAESDYYDLIAADYDRLFQEVDSNLAVRQSVQDYSSKHVRNAVVMDFGGGTGLDLPWLLGISRKIYFCEPSRKMRNIAMRRVSDHPSREKILFLDDVNSQLSNWSPGIPTEDKIDACLANFAVLNNIRDPRTAFEKLASAIKPGGDLIINVLDARLRRLITRYTRAYIRSFFSNEVITHTRYQGLIQNVYLHPPAKLTMSASPFFELRHTMPLKAFGFLLIHLQRR